MSEQAIEIGDKVHIITRRLFEADGWRHFAGEVIGISGELHAVRGYAFVFKPGSNEYKKHPELRTRLVSLGAAGLIVNKIPREVAIESIQYRFIESHLVVTDNEKFSLDMSEFEPYS